MVFDYVDKSFGIPIVNIENMESFQPVDKEIRGDSFVISLDEIYSLIELNSGGIVVEERNGAGGSFFVKNVIQGLQEKRESKSLNPYHFFNIDANIVEMCSRKNISLSQYVDSLRKTINADNDTTIDYDHIVFVSNDVDSADMLARISPSFGFKTIIDIHDGVFGRIFKDKATTHIAKRLASGWGVFNSSFNEIEPHLFSHIVKSMVNYDFRNKELSKEITVDFVEEKMNLFDDEIQKDKEKLNVYKALSRIDEAGEFTLPPSFYAKFIELYINLEENSTSAKYSKIEDFPQEDYDRVILSETIDFFTMWTVSLENSEMLENFGDANQGNTQAIRISEKDLENIFSSLGGDLAEALFGEENTPKEEEEKEAQAEITDLNTLKEKIKKEVIGQDDVVDEIVHSFSLPKAGLRDETKPVRSIIAAGSTGVGKALHKDTVIPTPYGYSTVEKLQKGDIIYSGQGGTCTIEEKYNPLVEEQFMISFSNGESILACGDHLWTVVNSQGEQITLDTKTLNETIAKESFYILTPAHIEDTWQARETVNNVDNADTIAQEYIDYIISVLNDSTVSYEEVKDVDFITLMPLEKRVDYVANIIDNVDNVRFEQSKQCTYVTFNIEDKTIQDVLLRLFSSVGVVGHIDCVVEESNLNNIHFTLTKDVALKSEKINSLDFDVENNEACRFVSIVDIECIDNNIFGNTDFYCFTVDSPDALFLCGQSHIPTHNTKLAYSLAKNLYSKPVELVRFDMSEFKEKHEISKLIGSGPGYQNANNGGMLTNAVMKNKDAIILVDEVEKASPEVIDVFLQILDAGRLTDGLGNLADFTNAVIIFTTNLGVKERKQNNLGFKNGSHAAISNATNTQSALKKFFRPEFLARVDDVVVFNDISDSAGLIVKQEINILREKMKKSGHTIKRINPSIVKFIVDKSDFSNYGARDIQRIVRKEIGEKVSLAIIDNLKNKKNTEDGEFKNINLSLKNNTITATIK